LELLDPTVASIAVVTTVAFLAIMASLTITAALATSDVASGAFLVSTFAVVDLPPSKLLGPVVVVAVFATAFGSGGGVVPFLVPTFGSDVGAAAFLALGFESGVGATTLLGRSSRCRRRPNISRW
jgi:hypothetical protein